MPPTETPTARFSPPARPSAAAPTPKADLDEILRNPVVRKAIEIFEADVVDVREEKR